MSQKKWLELSKALGYIFKNHTYLEQALTHPSAGDPQAINYERLEFLGDRVLGLAIAELLFQTWPTAQEGELARRYSKLVSREMLAEIGGIMNLEHYLRFAGRAPNHSLSQSVIADCCEAVLGAIFLDGGYENVRDFIARYWQHPIVDTKLQQQDPKSALQEWAQAKGLPVPTYTCIEQSGKAHAPFFIIEAAIPPDHKARGEGNSKRIASREAAQNLLQQVIHEHS